MSVQEAAEDVRDLARGEHLVLFGFRLTALGHGDCPVLHRTFHGLLEGEGDAALGHLLVFVRLIGAAGRRRVRLHMPGCCGLTDDERRVLGALAAAQASLHHGEEEGLRAGLEELLGTPPSEACLMAAQNVAATLSVCGLDMPLRAAPVATEPRATLH